MAIIGDAYSAEEAAQLNETADMLVSEWPDHEIVVVPKHRAALEILDEDLVLGYAMGYSDIHATDFSDPVDWRGRRVHLLGASPHRQYDVIEELTQPTLSNDPPADIVGLDWNGVQKVAYIGEHWTPDGWQCADHLSIRETVRKSLQEIKRFWEDCGVWPDTEPIDRYGPAVRDPDEPLYAVNATDITSREQLEAAIVAEYEKYGTLAFQTETERAWFEYSEGLSEFWEP